MSNPDKSDVVERLLAFKCSERNGMPVPPRVCEEAASAILALREALKEEQERCAKVADDYARRALAIDAEDGDESYTVKGAECTARHIAKAIRALANAAHQEETLPSSGEER